MIISRQRERISSNLTCLIREQRNKKMGGSPRRDKLLGLNGSPAATMDSAGDLAEEEVWGAEEPQCDDQLVRHEKNRVFRKWLSSSNCNWEGNSSALGGSPAPGSASRMPTPINVPDWAAILQRQRKNSAGSLEEYEPHDDDGEAEKENEWIPPHALAARQDAARIRSSSMVAFSVVEGVGRTLKGRDLSRVRNAVWERIGLID